MIWGVSTALFLTLERIRRHRKKQRFTALPLTARRILTAAAVLLGMAMMGSRTPFDAFGCYAAMLCINGIRLSDRVAYLLNTHWASVCIALAGLLPLRQLMPTENVWSERVRQIAQPLAELAMLLFAFSELLSRYLRP